MASGISAKLPLTINEVFGAYDLNTNFRDLATQNLKMLLLTNPGERIMNPNFGVGLRRFFFENNDPSTWSQISDRTIEQARIYMNFIRIDNINYNYREDNPDLFPHSLAMTITFTIIPLQISTTLLIPVN
jgi:phage baseplate assembly protein W